jgi:hypothetical protein
MNFKEKLQGFCKRHSKLVTVLAAGLTVLVAFVRPAYATDDTGTMIQSWMPTIISFAMLAMVMSFMKKMGR